MLTRLRWVFLICALFFFSPFLIFSNDGSYTKIDGSQTGAALPIHNDAIWMMDEDIKITLDNIGFDSEWLGMGMTRPHVTGGRVVTKCIFTFKNTSSERQDVLLGYPVTRPIQIVDFGNRKYRIENIRKQPDLEYFEVRVNDKEIPFEFTTHETNPSLPNVGTYQGVYLFKVLFEPDETKKISNLVIQENDWWPGNPEHQYILTTGSTWSKPIGHSHLAISFPNIEKEILEFKPLTYDPVSVNETIYEYDFKNFTPEKDLRFQFDLKLGKTSNLGIALRRCHAEKKYQAIFRIYQIMTSGVSIKLSEANLDPDFLRRMYFDAGNYFHEQNQFEISAAMFRMSLFWSNPIINWEKEIDGIDSDKFGSYMNSVSSTETWNALLKTPKSRIQYDTSTQAPVYFSAYNLFCAETRLGHENLDGLELALALGFPKNQYSLIRKDPDLASLRKFQSKELEVLLKKYEAMK